jgi:hypothetical protein
MLKKNANTQKVIGLFVITCVFGFLLSSCTEKQNSSKIDHCLHNQSCLKLNTKNATISFDANYIISETPTNLTIDTPNKKITKAWLTAQNMNMGDVPIFLNEVKTGQYIGLLMIGMCNQPIMQWRLNIKYKDGSLEFVNLRSLWSIEHAQSVE